MLSEAQNIELPSASIKFSIEAPKTILPEEELVLIETAIGQNPVNVTLRTKQANCLQQLGRFEQAVEVLKTLADQDDDGSVYAQLGFLYLYLESAESDKLAEQTSLKALDLTENDLVRANALATLGKAQSRLGDSKKAEQSFIAALRLNPNNKDAFKRLAALLMADRRFDHLLQHIRRLGDLGINHSRLLCANGLSQIMVDDIEPARKTFGLDQFLHKSKLAPPSGWNSIEEFNADIVKEMSEHPSLRFDAPGAASTQTWRVDHPATRRSAVIPILQKMIFKTVRNFVDTIADRDHPWARAIPSKGELHNWCVMTDGDGYEEWHVHQQGWLSGVYYAGVPDSVLNGTDSGGCIAFGVPAEMVGEKSQADYGIQLVRPTNGLLMLFPSHCYHRTFPHIDGGRRTCVAFDIKPL